MTTYEQIQRDITNQNERAQIKVDELSEVFKDALEKGFNAFCYDFKWRANKTLEANVQLQLWQEALAIVSNKEHTIQENLEELRRYQDRINSKFMNCSLSNIRVDGHGIQELCEYTAMAEFLKDFKQVLNLASQK